MEKIYTKEYDLRTGDFDRFNRIKASSVLDLFQDAAGRHAEKIGAGFEAMAARSYIWVLVKIKFRIVSQPAFHQRVIVKTWPLAPNKFIYRREYCIEGENGEKLIEGSSEWVVMHSEMRRLVSAPDLYVIEGGFHDEMNFEEKLGRIGDFETGNSPYRMTPMFSVIDVNNHVNNTKYADFVSDAVNPEYESETEVFQIEYRKEVLPGTELNIYHVKDDSSVIAKGLDENGDIMFSCKIDYR